MKPTQQEIIELAREVGVVFDERAMPYYERLVHLALERFGAGGGGPARGVVIRDGLPTLLSDRDIKTSDTRLYTHPSPTDLRAEYLRGLDDALSAAVDAVAFTGGAVDTEARVRFAIEALKGKQ